MKNEELNNVVETEEIELDELEESRYSAKDVAKIGGVVAIGGFALKGLYDTGKTAVKKLKVWNENRKTKANNSDQPKKESKFKNLFKKKEAVETAEIPTEESK